MAKVVVSDPLAPEGFQMLADRGHDAVDITSMDDAERLQHIAEAEAWVIRSGTTLGPDEFAVAPKLRAVGRAGVGVDNVDQAAATAAGVAVFNAPTGNITSAAEQAWALLFAAARRVVNADNGMKQEQWLRKQLKGTELAGKTIFIVGLGRIGRMMAKRAQAFEMKTIGFDPFVTAEAAKGFGVEAVSIDEGMQRADIVTLHTPLTPQTRDTIDADRLALAKDGLIVVNAARGGLIDEAALFEALESGKVAGAGIDVWAEEPPTDWALAKHPKVVAAPHLGASTVEAQLKAATQAIERVCDFLDTGDASLALNVQATISDTLRPWAELTEALSGFAVQCLGKPVKQVTVASTEGVDAGPLSVHALVGALRVNLDIPVNAINAPGLADERGWTIAHRQLLDEGPPYIRVEVSSDDQTIVIEGTHTPHYGGRVTMLDGHDVEFRPEGRFLLTRHQDVPGVLARITGILADAEVNVASVSLARKDREALAVIKVDGSIPKQARDALRQVDVIREAHRIRLL